MPHFPARIIKDKATLADWIDRYTSEAGVKQALLLAGGVDAPKGDFESSMQLLETGLFDEFGFTDLNVAGHPEGNKDIDVDNTFKNVDMALEWKQKFSERTDASMGITTQFAFDSKPIFDWANRIQESGINLPINVGIAGPAKLQTLIKFAIACGVGPSLKVLQKRAMDITKLLLPYDPADVLNKLAIGKPQNPNANISSIHFFPLGGIKANAEWISNNLTKNIMSA
jgi:methylenetetrahydrofolate reductase (NADPH)